MTVVNNQGSAVTQLPSHIDPAWLKSFRSRLLAWYRRDGRSLPWRETSDAYHVLVSEIMLQQTQTSTVIPYYHRFLERFPTAKDLAQASESEVLSLWEGLGYYRRAKSLHKAAIAIADRHEGSFPEDFESILALPGVGRYTAGAVASFAFDQAKPIVEANTQRLYSRLLSWDEELSTSRSQQVLWNFAEAILPRTSPGEMNHAVMDLGAMVCKPKAPLCIVCPLQTLCPTFATQRQDEIPRKKPRVKFIDHYEIAVSIFDSQDRLFIWRRPEDGWWSGLWDLPRWNCEGFSDQSIQRFQDWFVEQFKFRCKLEEPLEIFRHSVTHHRIQCQLFAGLVASKTRKNVDFDSGTEPVAATGRRGALANQAIREDKFAIHGTWATPAQLKELPFSSSGRKMVNWLLKK